MLAPGQNDGDRLRLCRFSSMYASSHAAELSGGRENRTLLEIAIQLLTLMEDGFRLLPKPVYGYDSSLYQDSDHYIRVLIAYFSMLRLLPTGFHLMLRYFAAKVFERGWGPDRMSTIFTLNTKDIEDKATWLCSAYNFLAFERTIITPKYAELGLVSDIIRSATLYQGTALYGRASCVNKISANAVLPILNRGRVLPSAAATIKAASYLHLTPYRTSIASSFHRIVLDEDHPASFPENARLELGEQMRCTREVVSRIDTPDGQSARELFAKLDLKAPRSLLTEQVHRGLTLSECGLREALAEKSSS